MNELNRLAELRAKSPLTEAELRELDRLTGRSLRAFPSPYELGVSLENSEVLRENLATLERKRIQARHSGYALEAIAIDTYRLEFLLVAWLVRHTRRRISLAEGTFGRKINEVEREGFEPTLVNRLRAFNAVRTTAIHRLLAGEARYDELFTTADQDPTLYEDILAVVGSTMPLLSATDGLVDGWTLLEDER